MRKSVVCGLVLLLSLLAAPKGTEAFLGGTNCCDYCETLTDWYKCCCELECCAASNGADTCGNGNPFPVRDGTKISLLKRWLKLIEWFYPGTASSLVPPPTFPEIMAAFWPDSAVSFTDFVANFAAGQKAMYFNIDPGPIARGLDDGSATVKIPEAVTRKGFEKTLMGALEPKKSAAGGGGELDNILETVWRPTIERGLYSSTGSSLATMRAAILDSILQEMVRVENLEIRKKEIEEEQKYLVECYEGIDALNYKDENGTTDRVKVELESAIIKLKLFQNMQNVLVADYLAAWVRMRGHSATAEAERYGNGFLHGSDIYRVLQMRIENKLRR